MTENESRNEKFCRIAENRTNNVLNALRLLGNCANRSNYDYTEQQVEQIFKAVDKAVAEMKSKYSTRKEETRFVLRRGQE